MGLLSRIFKPKKQEPRTECWCECGNELCGSGSWLGEDANDFANEYYVCDECGAVSRWHFESPVPFMLDVPDEVLFAPAFGPQGVTAKLVSVDLRRAANDSQPSEGGE